MLISLNIIKKIQYFIIQVYNVHYTFHYKIIIITYRYNNLIKINKQVL